MQAEGKGDLDRIDLDWKESRFAKALFRLDPHPAGLHGIVGPDDDHAPARLQLLLNQLIKDLTGTGLPIPPDRPAFALERADQRLNAVLVLA